MHIVCVCGLGMGSSLILKMTVDKALKELEVTGHDIEHWDAGTVDSRNADLIVTSADFESRFAGRDNVVFVTNVVNKEEVKGKLKAYLESHNLYGHEASGLSQICGANSPGGGSAFGQGVLRRRPSGTAHLAESA